MRRNENVRKFSLVVLIIIFIGFTVVDAEQNECLPAFAKNPPISTDIISGGNEVVQGGSFFAEAPFKYNRRTCKDPIPARLTWQAFINGEPTTVVAFSDKHVEKVRITVNNGAPTGTWVTLRVTIAFVNDTNLVGHSVKEKIKVFIVSKPSSPKIVLDSSLLEVDSKVPFNVPFETMEAYGSSNNFVHDCSLVLRDEQGVIADTDQIDTDFGKPMPVAKLKAKKPGIHTIAVSCRDSYGTIGTTTGSISVDLGNKDKKSPPVINIIDNPVNCRIGDCFIRYYINAYNKSMNVTCYDTIRGITVRGDDQFCKFNFTKQGNYPVKITTRFLLGNDGNKFIYSNPAEAFITVIVGQSQAQQSASSTQQYQQPRQIATPAAVIPQSISLDNSGCGKNGEGCKTSPGIETFAGIFTLVILALRKRK